MGLGMLKSALGRCNAVINTAQQQAMQKAAAFNIMGGGGGAGGLVTDDWKTTAAQRRNYAEFRGWLYAAINVLASEAAGQPVHLGKMRSTTKYDEALVTKGGRTGRIAGARLAANKRLISRMPSSIRNKALHSNMEVVDDHPMLSALHRPNPMQTRWQFVYSFIANLNLTGWAYVVGGQVKDKFEFYSVPTSWVKPDHSKGPFSSFRIVDPKNPTAASSAKPLPRENVAFAYLPNPADPMSAIAPASAQQDAIAIDNFIQQSQSQFFENGMFPSAIVTVGKDPHPDVPGGIRPRLTATQRRQVMGAIKRVMSGIANYGNPAIVDGLIESIERMSPTQNEIGWEKSEGTVRTRILSAFAVHPYILGEAVSVGGYAQAAKIEERFCKRVNTYLDMLSVVMTHFIDDNDEDGMEKLLVWWEETEARDPSLFWSNVKAARANGDLTRNEYRALLNLPPDETGGDRTKQFTSTDISTIVTVQATVAGGQMTPEQAAKIYEIAFDLSPDDAIALAGTVSAEQQNTEAINAATDALKAAMTSLQGGVVTAGYISQTAADVANAIELDLAGGDILDAMRGFNPDQPRDQWGRFTSDGGSGNDPAKDEFTGNPAGRDTFEKYRDAATGKWTKEREKLHREIVAKHFEGKSPVDNPVGYMMGGGSASGKSSVIKTGQVTVPDNTVTVDSDHIKGMLPDYKQMLADNDPRAAAFAHEESSYVAKLVHKEAATRGYNTLLDGTGNSSLPSLQAKTDMIRAAGQKVVAHYVTVDSDTAVARSMARAAKTGRMVPESAIRAIHKSVSSVVPGAVKAGLFDEFDLHDTSTNPPTKVASARGSELTVHNEELWQKFKNKAHE